MQKFNNVIFLRIWTWKFHIQGYIFPFFRDFRFFRFCTVSSFQTSNYPREIILYTLLSNRCCCTKSVKASPNKACYKSFKFTEVIQRNLLLYYSLKPLFEEGNPSKVKLISIFNEQLQGAKNCSVIVKLCCGDWQETGEI